MPTHVAARLIGMSAYASSASQLASRAFDVGTASRVGPPGARASTPLWLDSWGTLRAELRSALVTMIDAEFATGGPLSKYRAASDQPWQRMEGAARQRTAGAG